jgi:cephalosporin-C deacetylase-like acetyl esterase
MNKKISSRGNYPSPRDIDKWADTVFRGASLSSCRIEMFSCECDRYLPAVRHLRETRYVRFSSRGRRPFVACWQPAPNGCAPLLVHVPAYGAEISIHPELAAQGFNVLAVNPLGYVTEKGAQTHLQDSDGNWPVFHDTLRYGPLKGYAEWLADCVLAVKWAWKRRDVIPGRISFFGTSQGGGGALLLASIFHKRGVRCVAADEPFLTGFLLGMELAKPGSAYNKLAAALENNRYAAKKIESLGFIDTLSHAHRLDCPVMLTAGKKDETSLPQTIEQLFNRLPFTRSLVYLQNAAHGYNREFVQLAQSWFRLYA